MNPQLLAVCFNLLFENLSDLACTFIGDVQLFLRYSPFLIYILRPFTSMILMDLFCSVSHSMRFLAQLLLPDLAACFLNINPSMFITATAPAKIKSLASPISSVAIFYNHSITID